MILSHETLFSQRILMELHQCKVSLVMIELDNMLPYEREIYVQMLNRHMEQKQRAQR